MKCLKKRTPNKKWVELLAGIREKHYCLAGAWKADKDHVGVEHIVVKRWAGRGKDHVAGVEHIAASERRA